jgi:hypothetical protein
MKQAVRSACRFLTGLIILPWRWSWYFILKRRMTFTGLHFATSQKVELFVIAPAVRPSYLVSRYNNLLYNVCWSFRRHCPLIRNSGDWSVDRGTLVCLEKCTSWSPVQSSPVNCCWSSPAQWCLVPSPAGPMTIFYCLTALGAFRPLQLQIVEACFAIYIHLFFLLSRFSLA